MSAADLGSRISGRGGSARAWLLALAAGLVAGMASWLMGEATQPWFAVSRVVGPGPPSIEEQQAFRAEYESSQTRTAAVGFGLLGGALGLTMGLAGSLVRGSPRRGTTTGLAGAALGAIVGALAATALMRVYFPLVDRVPLSRNALGIPLMIHIGLWSPIGAAGGWAWGMGLGRDKVLAKAVLGGFLGALLGSIVYDLVGALALPLAMTSRPVSVTAGSRLLARLLVAGLAAVGAAATSAMPTTAPHPRATG